MFDQILLLVQAISVALLAAWLTLGVWDNIVHPDINFGFLSQVLKMTRMRAEYPAEYAIMAHRAVSEPATIRILFRLVILAELVATALIWLGVIWLLFSVAGVTAPDTARAIAVSGALSFTAIWGAFLIFGNYFGYWICHEAAQLTHFHMTLWGLGNVILLAQG